MYLPRKRRWTGGSRRGESGGRVEVWGGVPFIVLLSFSRGFNSSVLQTRRRRRRRKGGGVVERLRGLRGWVGGDDGGMKRRRFRDDGKRRERKWRLAGAGKKRCCLS